MGLTTSGQPLNNESFPMHGVPKKIILFRLDNKVAVVTGGAGGLGRAMAEALHDAGARVAVIGRSERVKELEQHGFMSIRGDLTHKGEPARVLSEVVQAFHQLDILVAAHGIARRGAAEDFSREDWDDTLETNLTSVFETAKAAGQHFLRQGKGKIVLIASMLSYSGGMNACAYAASKGGIAHLTKALANEWAGRGVNVNAIAPGYFETPMTQALRDDPKKNQQILDRLPARRWGKPHELAGALVFLTSAASDYVHGTILPVDGGWLAR